MLKMTNDYSQFGKIGLLITKKNYNYIIFIK